MPRAELITLETVPVEMRDLALAFETCAVRWARKIGLPEEAADLYQEMWIIWTERGPTATTERGAIVREQKPAFIAEWCARRAAGAYGRRMRRRAQASMALNEDTAAAAGDLDLVTRIDLERLLSELSAKEREIALALLDGYKSGIGPAAGSRSRPSGSHWRTVRQVKEKLATVLFPPQQTAPRQLTLGL